MIDRLDSDGLQLPPELAELESELESIRYEERPSFGPELRAELEREWDELRHRRRWNVRPLLAASVAALLMVGLGVPSARAALVRFVGAVQNRVSEAARPVPRSLTVPALPVDQTASPVVRGGEPQDTPRLPADAPVPDAKAAEPYAGPEATMPELVDRPGVEALIRRNYPIDLQRAGIGGVVGLQLWVDSTGAVDVANLAKGSGYGRLDKAALQVAPTFHFDPARRRGRAVGTWVEFDVRFQVPSDDSVSAPAVRAPRGAGAAGMAELLRPITTDWRGSADFSAPIDREAGDLLTEALDDDLIHRLGPINAILEGEPPSGVAPTAWRTQVGDALERAITHDPDNPAPFLALARLRRRQGLQSEARILFERGLQRAERAPEGSPRTVLAELQYERGTLVKEKWLASRELGRLPVDALPQDGCPQARNAGAAASGFASVERLIAWNYMCPVELGRAMESSFQPSGTDADADYVMMMASFRSAVDAYPAHVGANVELLLELADEWRWDDVLDGAERFVAASKGHPYGLLLEGLALQRLGRSEEADARFRRAFRGLPASEAGELQDPGVLLDAAQTGQFRSLERAERATWLKRFWSPLDPILTTEVNEREVEHYARTAYAHLRFGGAMSDAGQVWVRYGRPNDVRVVGDASGVRTEFWDYGSSAPALTFRRLASSENMDLTSEGKAYLDDLSGVFPQRYGADARMVTPLAGQVSRFRGDLPSSSVVSVNTEVPAGFATGERDTLDVGVFLLSEDGERLSSDVRRIPATPEPLSVVLPAGPDVRTVAVEFFHKRLGQAATLRQPAHGHEGDPGIAYSDVLVVGAADPSVGEVRRDADWVHPYPLGQPVAEDSVGLLFEMYGLSPAVTEYRLRVELQDRSTHQVRSIPIRPVGLDGFGGTWDRKPAADGTTFEYVTANLSGVPAGRYVLRVIADLPEANRSLILQRDLDRR